MKIIPNVTLQDDSSGSPVYHAAGNEVDLDDAIAQELVEKGHATVVPGQVQTVKPKSLPKPRSTSKSSSPTDEKLNAGETGKGGDQKENLDDPGSDGSNNGGGDGLSGSSEPSGQQSP